MARGKRSTPTLTLSEEIQQQGILALLGSDDSSSAIVEIKAQFLDWLCEQEVPTFRQLSQEFATWKIDRLREEGSHVS